MSFPRASQAESSPAPCLYDRPTALRSMYGSAESRLDANVAGVIGFLGRWMLKSTVKGCDNIPTSDKQYWIGLENPERPSRQIQAPRLVSSDRLGRNLKLSERR